MPPYTIHQRCVVQRFRIIVIEFHGLDAIFVGRGYEYIHDAFSKLLKFFDVVHIHPNNCCGGCYRWLLNGPTHNGIYVFAQR